MGKIEIKANGKTQHSFSNLKTYSIAEIQEAGGAMAFATKLNKNPAHIPDKLKEFIKEDFLTEEEVAAALKVLRDTK